MNTISEEKELSKRYYLSRVNKSDDSSLIKLSKGNVARVEAMIHFNSSYTKTFDKNAVDSSAHYFMELNDVLINKKKISNDDYRVLIKNVVKALDRENSTHLNSDRTGIDTMTDRICRIKKADLVRYLKNPVETNYKLLHTLAEKTTPAKKSKNNAKLVGRRNPSFASKFCHYACFFLFDGKKEQDNYSIYDSVIRKALPQYMEYYKVADRNLNDYIEYQRTIDEIIKKSKSGISRNGFDHLLWYCYKIVNN